MLLVPKSKCEPIFDSVILFWNNQIQLKMQHNNNFGRMTQLKNGIRSYWILLCLMIHLSLQWIELSVKLLTFTYLYQAQNHPVLIGFIKAYDAKDQHKLANKWEGSGGQVRNQKSLLRVKSSQLTSGIMWGEMLGN